MKLSKMDLSQIKQYLREAPNNVEGRQSDEVRASLEALKQQAVLSKNESFANALWAYEQLLTIQDEYISAFNHIINSKYYEGWCCLANVEKIIHFLKPHYRSAYKCFYVDFIDEQTTKFQALFPYRIFFSIEAVAIRKTCSICGVEIKLRSACEHKTGQIYHGRFCGRRIEKVKLPAVSLVTSPEDKRCVAFAGGAGTQDNYDYSLVRCLVSELKSPFDKWDFTETKKRLPHSQFTSVASGDPCPCESDKIYVDCCLPEEGVLRPHYNFTLAGSDSRKSGVIHLGASKIT